MATARIPDERVGGSDERATAGQGRAGNGSTVQACRRACNGRGLSAEGQPPNDGGYCDGYR